jgi:asparagine synthase (glutamine-hydrolysing)
LAALTVAESAFEQGVRISGLGGEVARGFYYVGSVHDRAYTRRDVEQLAAWRMFANETIETELLDPEFARWARAAADDAVFEAISAGGPEWFRATDELYLRHRMQRWAGVTDTAVAYQRIVINPMLDEDFLGIAARLTPQDKAHSRFLASLQMELDPELGRIPLEGRPAPVDYARPSAASSVRRTATTARKAARKVAQRLRGGTRAPAGGEVIAAKVVAHWRQHPEELGPLADIPFLSGAWISEMLEGGRDPRPSSVAFVTDLIAASGPDAGRPH